MKFIFMPFKKIAYNFLDRISELEIGPSINLNRLVHGLQWFMNGSIMDREAPTKHAIRITDVIVARASALLTHLSVMLAMAIFVFGYFYPTDNKHLDPIGYVMAFEIFAYLLFTLLCLESIHISGPSAFVVSKDQAEIRKLIDSLEQSSDEKVKGMLDYYRMWDDNGHKSINENFVRYTFKVLSRRRSYLRALIGTYAITCLFLLTTVVEFSGLLR